MTYRLWLDGIALWSPTLPGWDSAQQALRGEAVAGAPASVLPRPAPELLAANERRRAPDAVLVALEVATRALAQSGQRAADVASVFCSTHGDLAVTDALCKTLATDALLLSPTRFHHSVHNAASGYWAIGSGSMAASTALASFDESFAVGLLEACVQCEADAQPVMLVAYDTPACGPLVSVNRSRGLLALALVLAPARSVNSQWALDWALQPGGASAPLPAPPPPLTPLRSAAAQALAANASAAALPLFEALALGDGCTLVWPLSAALHLQLRLHRLPLNAPDAAA